MRADKGGSPDEYNALTKEEIRTLKKVFSFLSESYQTSSLGNTRLATDQTHFYILATALIGSDLLDRLSKHDLTEKLVKFANLLSQPAPDLLAPTGDALTDTVNKYRDLSTEKTTDASRRKERQQKFIEAIDLL